MRILLLLIGLIITGSMERVRAVPPYPYNFSFSPGQAFAFIGDETTYDGRYCQYVENFFYTRYPDRKLIFYNAGCKNDTAADVIERLDQDVIERRIDYALVMLGTWDGGLEPFQPVRFEAYKANMQELLDRLKKARIYPFLMSPPMVDILTHRQRVREDESYRFRLKPLPEDYNGVMGYYSAWLRDLAVERKMRYVDCWNQLNAITSLERKTNPMFTLVPDAIQPDAGGHAVMAGAVIESLAPERASSLREILLSYTGGEKGWESRVSGGSLSQLSGSDSRISFIWKAKSLPWALPDDAFIGGQLANLDERFNREKLQVFGLQAGEYKLLIAGQHVGTFNALDLARGVALHKLWDRPQFQRAQAVARMNQERYRSTIHPLRDLWQEVKRVRVNFPHDDARQQAILTQLRPKMNALRIQAREKADKIYEAARPLGRNFELQRIYSKSELKAIEAARKKAKAEARKKAAGAEAAKKAAESN